MKKLVLAFAVVFCYSSSLFSQDSTRVLTLDEVLGLVARYHPISLQADLLTQQARQKLIKARGGFDPKLFSDYAEKDFDGKDYYLINETGLKVPAWFAEVKASYEINRGIQLNDQIEIPNAGQAVLGISVPLADGLWIDDRRAVLKQAKIFQETAAFAREAMLNDLYFETIQIYWKWSELFGMVDFLEDAESFASDQLEYVRKSVEQGDVRAIDTVEAAIQLRNVQLLLESTRLDFNNARLELSNFLWMEDFTPLEIDEATIPSLLSDIAVERMPVEDSLLMLVETLDTQHPALQAMQTDLEALGVERKLRANQLLPTANINYNLLSADGLNWETGPVETTLLRNYKWGFQFSMPIFLGKERGELGLIKTKIKESRLKLDLKIYEQQNKVKAYYNNLVAIRTQIGMAEEMVVGYRELLQGERQLFANGESSLFVINSRQAKLINAQQKLLELQGKYQKNIAAVNWALGILE